MRPLPTTADCSPGSAVHPKRNPGSVKEAPWGSGYGHSMTRVRIGCFTSEMLFFRGWWGQGKRLVLDGDPGSYPGLSGDTGLEGKSRSSAE